MKYDLRAAPERRRIKRRWTNHPIILGLAFLLLLFFARAAFRVYENKKESDLAAVEAKAQLKELNEREEYLTAALKRLSTTEGRTVELRKKFGFALPDENVAIIVEGENTATSSSESGILDQIKTFFLGWFK